MAINKTTALMADGYLSIYVAPSTGAGSVTVNLRNSSDSNTSIGLALVPQKSLSVHSTNISNRGQFTATPEVSITGATSDSNTVTDETFRVKTVSSVAAVGAGYEVGDVLTISGGSPDTGAELIVSAVDGVGAVTAAVINNSGAGYTAVLPDPVSVTGGTGAGAEFSLFWELDTFSMTGAGFDGMPIVRLGSGASAATIEITMSCTPETHHVIDGTPNFSVGAVLERSGLVVKDGWMLAAKGADCSAAVWGFEQV